MNSRDYPKIVSRRTVVVSPWVSLVEKSVKFNAEGPVEVFHCLTQADYVSVFAMTPEGQVPIVRQFRPCVEDYTWEFPGGTVDRGESPAAAAQRELEEEAGLKIDRLVPLGEFLPDTGRLQLGSHAFFARTKTPDGSFKGEAGLELRFVTLADLRTMMLRMEFRHQLHWAIYAAALVHGVDLQVERANG